MYNKVKCASFLYQASLVFFFLNIWLLPEGTNSIPHGSLYVSTDNVTILDVSNFKSTVLRNPEKAWVVEFYNSWCGDCQRYSPIWKKFAKNIYNWQDIVTVAVVECSLDKNAQLCRDYEVTKYPTIRYYPPNSPPGFLGDRLKQLFSIADLRHQTLEYVLKSASMKSAGLSWPSFQTSENLTEAKSKLSSETKYIAVMFEGTKSLLGVELILDFHHVEELKILRITDPSSGYVTDFNVTKFPSLYVKEQGFPFELLPVTNTSRKDFFNTTKLYLSRHGISVPDIDYNETVAKPEIVLDHSALADRPFKPDIEMAFRHALFHELKTRKVFEGETLAALQRFLRVVARYFPLNDIGAALLRQFTNTIQDHQGSLTGEAYDNFIQPLESRTSEYLSEPGFYVNCAKSSGQPPCSLWLLFHTLTARAHLKHHQVNDSDPKDVLNSIHGYVKHFFGCTDCSLHFQSMAVSINSSVDSYNSSMLWLWTAHNQVNDRLSRDIVPARPKVQFPTSVSCPSCRVRGKWDLNEVLTYLKSIYTFPPSVPRSTVTKLFPTEPSLLLNQAKAHH